MTTVGESLVATHFLTRGDNRSSRNKVECFDINRANKWVQACQSFREPPRRRSVARLSSETLPDGEALPVPRPSLTPKFIIPATESTPGQQCKGGGVLLGKPPFYTTTPTARPPTKRTSRRRKTTPLNHRPSKDHPRAFNIK